ncbi:MAG: flagellar basal body rod protein FlgC [Candidatus Zixiibacteriota bacterium]
MDGIFSAIEISGKGMSVQRRKMNVVSENIANAETTRTENGGPYRRKRLEITAESEKIPFKTILQKSQNSLIRTHSSHIEAPAITSKFYGNVEVANGKEVSEGQDSFKLVYDPGHPDADEEGYVRMPDIEIINEMVDMIAANRSYEANAMAVSASKEMAKNALDI